MTGVAEASAHLRAATDEVATLLASARDGSVPVRGSDWTVAEVGAHLVTGLRAYTGAVLTGRPVSAGPDHMAATNARMIGEEPERRTAALAARLLEAREEFLAVTAASTDLTSAWHGAIRLGLPDLIALLIGEALVHGRDLARALDRRWPIAPEPAVAVLGALAAVTPHFVDPRGAAGLAATYDVRIRRGPAWTYRFDRGALAVAPGSPERADCHLSADAATFLLVSYGRLTPWGAALAGRITSWGRRPWLGLRMSAALRTP